jgi:hypothetical protein
MTPADDTHDDLGERLATWLEGLDLGAHLGAAGLPTFVRDDRGRAVWTDPGTGRPLSADQLGQLDLLLHSEGSEPEHAVPVPLLVIARQARLRADLLASPWFSYETLARRRGTSLEATRFAVHKAGNEHRLLVVAADERTLVPAFQLDADGELRPELLPVLEPLLAAGMEPWRAWAWLTQPAALLGGQVPERAAADPEEARVVAHAAARLAERVADRS